MNVEEIARIAHAVNRDYRQALGDDPGPVWREVLPERRAGIIQGVRWHLANPDATPTDSHNNWLDNMKKQGYQYGQVIDLRQKLHPCIVPFDQLPRKEQIKDTIFKSLVHTLANRAYWSSTV